MFALILLAQAPVQIPGPGCETVGTELFCPPANISDPYYGPVEEIMFADRVRKARKFLAEKERSTVDRRKRVGTLMANHDCEGAYKLALTEGDLELAAQARLLCTNPNSD